jgi:hypothetical protein
MAKRLQKISHDTAYHGNAGEASAFLAIADKKLVPEGVLALVLHLSLQAGTGWEKARKLLKRSYQGVCIINIAARKDSEASFSADTDMGECLVVAHKSQEGSKRAPFCNTCPTS